MVVVAPEYDIPRDLHGYGEHPPDPRWPNGARIAVSFVLNYEFVSPRRLKNPACSCRAIRTGQDKRLT